MKKTVYLAGGCFWGVQKYLALIPGVLETEVGYANSKMAAPTYELVSRGVTDAAEAVRCVYDSERISLDELLFMFFAIIDPLSRDRQGNDVGRQYRTGVYYFDPDDQTAISAALTELAGRYHQPLAVEEGLLMNFTAAEGYHQSYLDKNPGGYCHIAPELFQNVDKRLAQLSAVRGLDDMGWAVTQLAATEAPFGNEFDRHFAPGIYVDVISGEALFSSKDKFDSGCGWPAFTQPVSDSLLLERPDYELGYQRTEVRSQGSNAHLGHVFDDGPAERGGLRYCINSAALRFIPLAEMAEQGYGELIASLGLEEA